MLRYIKSLLTVFIILLAFALLVWKINQPEKNQKDVPLLKGKAENVASFELNNFTLGLLFTKDNGKWMVKKQKNALVKELEAKAQAPILGHETDSVEAKTDDVNELLNDLFSLENLEVVATQKTENNIFEINAYSLHLIFYDTNGSGLDRLYFGKHGPQMGTLFVKKGNGDAVYLLDRDFSVSLLRQYNEWLLNPPSDTEKKTDGKKKE